MNKLLRFVVAVSIGISRDQWQRRRVIFILLLAAMSMFAAGAFLLGGWFATNPLAFAIHWLVCVFILVCVILLAIYDLLEVIRAGREERRTVRREVYKDIR
jgi:uncharacterized membrane protein